MLNSSVKIEWAIVIFGLVFTALAFLEGAYVWLCSLMLPVFWLVAGTGFGTSLLALSGLFVGFALASGANPSGIGFGPGPVLLGAAMVLTGTVLARKVDRDFRWLLASVLAAALLPAFGGSSSGPGGLTAWLQGLGIAPELAWQITVALRKSIHFGYFGFIALTAFWGSGRSKPMWSITWAVLHAAFDENRQASSAGRTGSIWDVLLDLAGAATFVGLALALSGREPQRR